MLKQFIFRLLTTSAPLTTAARSSNRIDVHHHYLPPAYLSAINDTYPIGSPNNPSWSLSITQSFMATHSINTTIFSVTDPPRGTVPAELSISIARQCNLYGASIRSSDPAHFGFFAMIPDPLAHPAAALEEIEYSLDNLKADGVALLTRYGNNTTYLGHEEYIPLWNLLEAKKATVFIHPSSPLNPTATLINPALVPPIIDYPHETTRTAIDLVLSNTLRTHPNVNIILAHSGGTLPYIALRAAELLPPILKSLNSTKYPPKTTDEILDELSDFYFDVALGSSELVLPFLTKFAKKGHVLFGSDFPYGGADAIDAFTRNLDEFEKSLGEAGEGDGIDRENAERLLFPRLRGQ